MEQSVSKPNSLAYDVSGAGLPVVFLHGLTFSKGTWRPIVDRLADRFRCVAIDLPAHGASSGPPASMEDVAGEIHRLLTELGITQPVIVGHSLAAMTATVYATLYPVAGVVNVDQPLDVMPFARMLRQLEPALRGPNFAAVFEPIRQSIGVELLPEPLRTSTRATQTVRQDVVLGYWDEALQRSPEELQAITDEAAGKIRVPYLAVFGRLLSEDERDRLQHRLCALELEEWPDQGHMVHLMEPGRFADRLAAFVARCTAGPAC
jgi:pimeloyl-ACP methyl ester carboxylesterase